MLKNKAIKLFLMLGLILFNIVCWSCTSSKSASVNASYIRTQFTGKVVEGEFSIADNHSDLDLLLNKDTPEKYNDSFFEKNSLLIFKIVEPSQGNKSEIKSYNIEKNLIRINVETIRTGDDCAMGYWWFILELSSEETNNFGHVKIFKNGEEIMNDDKQLMSDYIQYAHSIGQDDLDIDEVKIIEKYGEYNGASIVKINRGAFQVITYVSFCDIDIIMQFPDSNTPLVYKNGTFYELGNAYTSGILTSENIIEFQEKYENSKEKNN